VPTCAGVSEFCQRSDAVGIRARQLCPATCGCNSPLSPLALYLPGGGCGKHCMRSGYYLDQRASMSCTDLSKDDPRFLAILDAWDTVRPDWGAYLSLRGEAMTRNLRLYGCAYLNSRESFLEARASGQIAFPPHFYGQNFCTELGTVWPIKPLSYFCPVTCGCRQGDPHCPDQCPARNVQIDPTCASVDRSGLFNPAAASTQFACPMMATSSPTLNSTSSSGA
jgi:hypothetical protein